jgi:pentapeptide MXKDX repeat protein
MAAGERNIPVVVREYFGSLATSGPVANGRVPFQLKEASMKWSVVCVAMQAAAIASLGAAQSGGGMKMNGMEMAPVSYTGCLEAGAGNTFTLTHAAETSMSKDGMAAKGMAKDSMAKDSMAKDGMAKPDTKMESAAMNHDSMASWTFALTAGPSVALKKHAGHKVSLTGTPVHGQMDADGKEIAAISVTSLKTIAKACS